MDAPADQGLDFEMAHLGPPVVFLAGYHLGQIRYGRKTRDGIAMVRGTRYG